MAREAETPRAGWTRHVAAAVIALVFVAPLVWMALTSLKTPAETLQRPPSVLPGALHTWPQRVVDNYVGEVGPDGEVITQGVWTDPVIDFPLYLRNTLLVALLSVTGMVLSSAIVAYGLSRVRWRGRGIVFVGMLATMMIPFPVLMGPLYLMYRELGWIGTFRPLWVPAWFGGAFSIFLLRQFYLGIPRELDDAARLDGCSHWGILWRVIIPLSRPALAAVAIFHFLYVWNDFLAPLIFLQRREQFTLALGLQMYQTQAGQVPWNLLMAASVLVVLPVLAVFVVAHRHLIQGIAVESEKG